MARRYVFTARRRAALRKAQLASARVRKRTSKMSRRKKAIVGVGVLAAVGSGWHGSRVGRDWRGWWQQGKLIQSYENSDRRPGARKMSNLEVYSYARYNFKVNPRRYRKRQLKKSVRKDIRGL